MMVLVSVSVVHCVVCDEAKCDVVRDFVMITVISVMWYLTL